jgi:biopolymer transport protein ExbD
MTLNLAPMVDVMMCLIIFFLLAAKLVSAEQYPVALPWAQAADEVKAGELGARATINVRRAAGRDDVAEYVVVDWDGRQIVERVLSRDEIETFLQRRRQAARDARDVLRCVIRADRDVQYQHVEVVLRAAALAGIERITFSVNAGSDPEGGDA